jgi:hypothetical protein
MPLSQEQQTTFDRWLGNKRIAPRCPACGHADSLVSGEIIAATLQTTSGELAGSTFPVVQRVCTNCAYLMMFAARPVGLA